jgi:hypothetical protein
VGQGSKNLGEVKPHTLERASLFWNLDYIVLPDPAGAAAKERYLAQGTKEFEPFACEHP